MHKIKLEAKRNRRQRKKLQAGEYQLVVAKISFRHSYDPDSEELDNLIGGCYIIANGYNCEIYGSFNKVYADLFGIEEGCVELVTYNKLYARDLTKCVMLIENYLIRTKLLVNSVRVVAHEAQDREINYFNYIDKISGKTVTEGGLDYA